MKKIILSISIITSSALAAADGSYILKGCIEDHCSEIDSGPVDDLRPFGPSIFKQAKEKNSKLLLETLSKGTGLAIDAIRTIIDGMRETALSAGYDRFKSELTGPSGNISIEMDLKTGEWSANVGGTIGSSQKHRN